MIIRQFISIVAPMMRHLHMNLIKVFLIHWTNLLYIMNFNYIREATMTDITGIRLD